MTVMENLLSVFSPTTLALLAVAGVIQLLLQIWCLLDLRRRPSVYGGKKWIWALIIIAAGLLGVAIYFGLGRQGTIDLGPDSGGGDEDSTRRAIDTLYGDKK